MATRAEFLHMMAYLELGCRAKEPVSEATAEVYWDLLGDLPGPLLLAAARRALLESQYPVFPPPGTLRRLAADLARPEVPAAEAWQLALRAVRRFGAGREAEGLASLPAAAARTLRAVGWQLLCDTADADLGYRQKVFLDAYGTIAGAERAAGLMPPELRAEAERLAAGFGMDDQERPALPARE